MGCDIHFHSEVKINGKWHHYGAPDLARNYALFAKMAGVRNSGEIEPLSLPKGIPEDATELTKFDAEYWSDDGHSFSWLGAEEIAELYQWVEENLYTDETAWKLERELWGYLFSNRWDYFPQSDLPELEGIRFIFWFDN